MCLLYSRLCVVMLYVQNIYVYSLFNDKHNNRNLSIRIFTQGKTSSFLCFPYPMERATPKSKIFPLEWSYLWSKIQQVESTFIQRRRHAI